MNHPISSRRRPLLGLPHAAMLAASVFSLAAAASAFPRESTIRVDLRSVDLSTAPGQLEARTRLLRAAHRACQQVEEEQDLSHHENFLACVDSALAQAMPRLAQLIARSGTAQLAGNATE